MAEPTTGPNECNPLPRLQISQQHAPPNSAPRARQRRRRLKTHRIRQPHSGNGVHTHELGKAAVARDARVAADVGAVVAAGLRAGAVGAAAAEAPRDAAHDAGTGRERHDGAAGRYDGARALVRRRARERGVECARSHHAVRVAQRGRRDFDEQVGGPEGVRNWHRAELVWRVVLLFVSVGCRRDPIWRTSTTWHACIVFGMGDMVLERGIGRYDVSSQ